MLFCGHGIPFWIGPVERKGNSSVNMCKGHARTADRMTWSHCAVALTRSFCFALFRAHQCSILITDRAQIMAAGPRAYFCGSTGSSVFVTGH